jgi:hypothetical protein
MSDGLIFTIPPAGLEALARRVAELLADLPPAAEPASPWLNTEHAAEYLDKQVGTFREEVRAGRWPFRLEGKRKYFHRAELDAARGQPGRR